MRYSSIKLQVEHGLRMPKPKMTQSFNEKIVKNSEKNNKNGFSNMII